MKHRPELQPNENDPLSRKYQGLGWLVSNRGRLGCLQALSFFIIYLRVRSLEKNDSEILRTGYGSVNASSTSSASDTTENVLIVAFVQMELLVSLCPPSASSERLPFPPLLGNVLQSSNSSRICKRKMFGGSFLLRQTGRVLRQYRSAAQGGVLCAWLLNI